MLLLTRDQINGQVSGILFSVSIYPIEIYLWLEHASGSKSAYSERK